MQSKIFKKIFIKLSIKVINRAAKILAIMANKRPQLLLINHKQRYIEKRVRIEISSIQAKITMRVVEDLIIPR
jgi:hypothetical protein